MWPVRMGVMLGPGRIAIVLMRVGILAVPFAVIAVGIPMRRIARSSGGLGGLLRSLVQGPGSLRGLGDLLPVPSFFLQALLIVEGAARLLRLPDPSGGLSGDGQRLCVVRALFRGGTGHDLRPAFVVLAGALDVLGRRTVHVVAFGGPALDRAARARRDQPGIALSQAATEAFTLGSGRLLLEAF